MNHNHLNLYIVDDDEAVRRSVGTLMIAHLAECSVKTFASGEAFLEGANLDASGVVLLDYIMDGMSGLEVFQALKDCNSPLSVVFLSGKGDVPVAVRAMEKGAVSWLSKPCTDAELLQTIQRGIVQATDMAVKRQDRHLAVQRLSPLTLREMQATALTTQGKSAKEGAQILTQLHPTFPIDFRTFENHRAKALAKLNVKNKVELLIFLHNSDLRSEVQASLNKSPGTTRD
jgi:FixJ family two-component response regulator